MMSFYMEALNWEAGSRTKPVLPYPEDIPELALMRLIHDKDGSVGQWVRRKRICQNRSLLALGTKLHLVLREQCRNNRGVLKRQRGQQKMQ